ncbi:MAG TPA: LemA family protein [Gemmatales bacterium]|nr:LemA family protein [Gemmatales bacterium]
MGRFLQRPEEHFDLEREWWHSGLAVVAGLLTVAFTSSVWAMRTYNNLVTFRVRADQFWSSLDVNLKQRFDLVPNLVEVVKGYQQYEADLFAWIARLRSEALTGSREDRVDREGDCVAGVQRLLALEEAYPELKANTLYMRFHDQLVALEEKIAHARTVYNDAVAEFNREVHHFPSNLVARLTGFVDLPLFSAELTERASPQVRLDASESAGAASSDPSAIAAEDGRPGLGTTGVG